MLTLTLKRHTLYERYMFPRISYIFEIYIPMNLDRRSFLLILFCVLIHSSIFAQFEYKGNLTSPYPFGWSFGITVDSQGKIYVADSDNNMVQVFNSDNSFSFKFGTAGSGNGQFNNPNSIVIDETNSFIYVSDRMNFRVQKFTMNGTFVAVIGGFDSTGDTNGKFYLTSGIALDSQGNLFVCDQRKIQKFDPMGNFVANIISLDQPADLEIDQNGNLFISQWNEKRILKTSPTGTVLQTYTSSDYPGGLDLDANGHVFAAYYKPSSSPKYNIRRFTNDLAYLTEYGTYGTAPGEFANQTLDVVVKSNGFAYVTENTRVQFFEVIGEPEIRLFYNNQELGLDGNHSFGSTLVGNSIEHSFEINNLLGTGPLELSDLVLPTGFELVGTFPSTIPVNGKANVKIKLLAASAGKFEGVLQFKTNDPDELTWRQNIEGTVVGIPEIRMFFNNQELSSNGNHSFGSTTVGTSIEQSFEINNLLGTGSLELSDLVLPTGFELVGTFPTTIPANAKANVKIKLLAASVGKSEGVLQFKTNDSDELTWKLNIDGTVVGIPEIRMFFNNQELSLDGNHSFGSTPFGTPVEQSFEINNLLGTVSLELSDLVLPAGFELVGTFPTTIPPNAKANISIRLLAASAGTFEGVLQFKTNDLDESVWRLNIDGTVAPLVTATPEEDIRTNTVRLYPNPANQFVSITSDGPIAMIALYDITGKEIKNIIGNKAGEIFLDVGQLPNGIYLCRYTLPGNRIDQQRLIVNK